MPNPTRFPNGITNAKTSNDLVWNVPLIDRRRWHDWFEDFDSYIAANWTVTETNASATEALTDVDGGVLLITNTGSDDDRVSMQELGEAWLLEAGKQAIFSCRFKVSDATQSDVQIGLVVTDTTSLDATDGVYFQKDDESAAVDLYVRKNATTGSNKTAGVATLADDTYIELAWRYDGVDKVYYYVNNVLKGSMSATSAYLPDTELTVTIYLQNGAAAVKTMSIDYIWAAKQRT